MFHGVNALHPCPVCGGFEGLGVETSNAIVHEIHASKTRSSSFAFLHEGSLSIYMSD